MSIHGYLDGAQPGKVPAGRSDWDLVIDTAWHEVAIATDPDTRRTRERRWRELILQRNAQRTSEEVEQLERERGLR